MKAFRLKLENFGGGSDSADSDFARALADAAAKGRGEGHAAGYAEGFAAADGAAEAADRAAVSSLRESVADLELAQRAAREEAIASLAPVLAALARAVAPDLAERGLDAALASAVSARLDAAPRARLVLRCAAERAEGLALRFGDRLDIRPDPALDGARARLEWDGGGADYDAEACVRAARAAIEDFFGEAGESISDVG